MSSSVSETLHSETAKTEQLPAVTPNKDNLEPLLCARHLSATGKKGRIFGPLDLDLYPGDLCVVTGNTGCGKTTLLVALGAHFKKPYGQLTIVGIDALEHPYKAMQHTALARIGNYIALEDRLTVEDAILERAYLDGISVKKAQERVLDMEEYMGYRLDRGVEIEQLPPIVRAIFSIGLMALRPADVIIYDDVDIFVRQEEKKYLYELIKKWCAFDNCVVIASAVEVGHVPEGTVVVNLDGGRHFPVQSIVEKDDQVQVMGKNNIFQQEMQSGEVRYIDAQGSDEMYEHLENPSSHVVKGGNA